MTALHVVVQRAALAERHADETALGGFRRLADGLGNLTGLAVTETDATLLVADDDEGREAEATAALHHLGDAVDVDELVHELAVALLAVVAATTLTLTCHVCVHRLTRAAVPLAVCHPP